MGFPMTYVWRCDEHAAVITSAPAVEEEQPRKHDRTVAQWLAEKLVDLACTIYDQGPCSRDTLCEWTGARPQDIPHDMRRLKLIGLCDYEEPRTSRDKGNVQVWLTPEGCEVVERHVEELRCG